MQRNREQGDVVLVSLPLADHPLPPAEVEALHVGPAVRIPSSSNTGGPGSVEPIHANELVGDRADFVAEQHHRGALRPLHPHEPIEPWRVDVADLARTEARHGERLVPGRRAELLVGREVVEVRGHPHPTEVRRGSPLLEPAIAPLPAAVGLFRAMAEVPEADRRARLLAKGAG